MTRSEDERGSYRGQNQRGWKINLFPKIAGVGLISARMHRGIGSDHSFMMSYDKEFDI
jgi:hypothetical protein